MSKVENKIVEDLTRNTKSSSFHSVVVLSPILHRGNLKTQQSPIILKLCLKKTWSEKSQNYRDAAIIFDKLCYQNVFRPHMKKNPVFSVTSRPV